MSIVLDVRTETGDRVVVDVDPGQKLMALTLGLSAILESAGADRLWLRAEDRYVPLGDDVADEVIANYLAEGELHAVVLAEREPAVLRGQG